ncbi:MAG: ribosome biogenesis GTPase Der [Puniceicoccales bacterium]|jgi:GTP-binding protein|nr:ribosome biogenesis GTPase Der [Puniceicoccales bacterium]
MKPFYGIAIVGRPNVGKSRLFNRLARARVSIVHDTPGVTRDIVTHEIGKNIILMDTGGFGLPQSEDSGAIASAVEDQVKFAIAAADLILFVVDATAGIVPMDYDIAHMLRRSGAKVYAIANRIDGHEKSHMADVFGAFGFGPPLIASAEHGIGEEEIRRLIDSETENFRAQLVAEESSGEPIKIALVGRPNVGKSSLVNALLHSQRMIVSDIPGTTREAVTSPCQWEDEIGGLRNFTLTDTAGTRPQNRISTPLDYFASLRARDSIIGSDVVLLVTDATGGIAKLDRKVANDICQIGRGVIVVVNKWDVAQEAIRKGELNNFSAIGDFQTSFADAVRNELRMLPGVEIAFVSAKTGYGMGSLLPLVEKLRDRMVAKIGTGELNRALQQLFDRRSPPSTNGRTFRVYYAVQTGNMPFTLKLFCNRRALLSGSYEKYMTNELRKRFDFSGCPVKLEFVEKDSRFAQKIAES